MQAKGCNPLYPNLDTTKTTGKEGDGRPLPRVEWMNGKQITRENKKQKKLWSIAVNAIVQGCDDPGGTGSRGTAPRGTR